MGEAKLDLRTHIRHPKTGQVIEARPYRLHINGKTRYFEMPKGSGEFFYEDGVKVPEADCPKLTPVVRVATEQEKLQTIRESIAKEHAELEKLRAEKALLNAEGPEVPKPQHFSTKSNK